MSTEERLKNLILSRYYSIAAFADATGLPYQTVNSILVRGVNKAGVQNIITICRTLGLNVEALAAGDFVYAKPPETSTPLEDLTSILTIQLKEGNVTFDGISLSPSECDFVLDSIDTMIEMLKRKRGKS